MGHSTAPSDAGHASHNLWTPLLHGWATATSRATAMQTVPTLPNEASPRRKCPHTTAGAQPCWGDSGRGGYHRGRKLGTVLGAIQPPGRGAVWRFGLPTVPTRIGKGHRCRRTRRRRHYLSHGAGYTTRPGGLGPARRGTARGPTAISVATSDTPHRGGGQKDRQASTRTHTPTGTARTMGHRRTIQLA